jgi:RNA polymerase sigma-70 factor (ECF subfamily)
LVQPSDEELCTEVAARHSGAFDQLVERYHRRAFRLALSVVGNDADAHDISQEAFIRLYQSAHRFDGRSRFSTWFYRIVVNLCIDHQRRTKWRRRLVPLASKTDDPDGEPIEPVADDLGPDDVVIRRETAASVNEMLNKLSPKRRLAVMLQVQDGLSSREIAAVLKCSESTARVHVYRGLMQLKKVFPKD